MANELKTTFSDMEAAAFKAYAEDLLEAYPRAPERQRLQAYLLQTIALDRASLVEDQTAINQKRLRRRDHQEILEEHPVLKRSIAVRNPYVDPINVVQAELLHRLRTEQDSHLLDALVVTVNGIAAGMRNTG